MRFWFFGSGGRVFIAQTHCGSEAGAKRMALDYNRVAGPLGPIDLITDGPDPQNARLRIAAETKVPEREEDEEGPRDPEP